MTDGATCPRSAPGGESLANACLRVDRVLTQLRESCSGFRVVLVCHGNIMLAFRIRLERMKQSTFRTLLGTSSSDTIIIARSLLTPRYVQATRRRRCTTVRSCTTRAATP